MRETLEVSRLVKRIAGSLGKRGDSLNYAIFGRDEEK